MRKPVPTPVGWRAHVSTLAGDGSPLFRDDQQRFQAGFSDPFGIAVATDGTLYVSDAGESNRIRKITREGVVTTLAGGSEGFADGTGKCSVIQHAFRYRARRERKSLRRRHRKQSHSPGDSGRTSIDSRGWRNRRVYLDGPGEQARFNGPMGVAVGANGNIFVADTYNDRIRVISPKGVVSTIAGAGTPGFADGTGKAALFDTPCGIVVTTDGSLIIADTGNDRLRKIDRERQRHHLGREG